MQEIILNIRKKLGYVPLEQYLQEKEETQTDLGFQNAR